MGHHLNGISVGVALRQVEDMIYSTYEMITQP